ncbi:MAG: 2-amino-4-hydroxy-6-hydroxymethyldihydropteridine diphosphokinase [Bacteroidaceae bacterium]|nr:2-amino-4-hydroxy-6-hydroxymethyldihydropteridine diphosphokinase [Bacteroidaceae bacterium]
MHIVFLALGSNLGDKIANLLNAYNLIQNRIGQITAQSDFIISKPWGFQSDNNFVNSVVKVTTQLEPFELLHTTQQIERDLGRASKSSNGIYHDRVIDIDILIYDSISINTPELIIPHPHMQSRSFVTYPLSQIDDSYVD